MTCNDNNNDKDNDNDRTITLPLALARGVKIVWKASHSVARLPQRPHNESRHRLCNMSKSDNGRGVYMCALPRPHVKHCKRMASLYEHTGKLRSAI